MVRLYRAAGRISREGFSVVEKSPNSHRISVESERTMKEVIWDVDHSTMYQHPVDEDVRVKLVNQGSKFRYFRNLYLPKTEVLGRRFEYWMEEEFSVYNWRVLTDVLADGVSLMCQNGLWGLNQKFEYKMVHSCRECGNPNARPAWTRVVDWSASEQEVCGV